jgi:hypothetical protein
MTKTEAIHYELKSVRSFAINADDIRAALVEAERIISEVSRVRHAGSDPVFISLIADYDYDGLLRQFILTIEDA